MNFNKIKIFNFKKFYKQELEIDLNQELRFQNGFGKTTILDAICYVFTNKLYNGNSQGYSSLDENNIDLNLKPNITLTLTHDNQEYEIVLKNGTRIVNGILYKTKKDFDEFCKVKFGFDVNDFAKLTNPFHILEQMATKEAREIFMKLLPHDFDFIADDFNESDVLQIKENIKIFGVLKVIETHKTNMRKHKATIDSLKTLINNYTETLVLNDLEKTQLANYEQIIDEINAIRIPNSDICFNCNQKIPNINNLIAELTAKKEQLISSIDYEHYNALKARKNAQVNLLDNLQQDLSKANEAYSESFKSFNLGLLYQEQMINSLEKKLKECFPFTIKLFHQNKSLQTYSETFSVLENGVDFKYLNWATKVNIGLEVINFLEKQNTTKLPLLLDSAESLDANNLQNLKQKTNKQLILTFVKQD